jgi:kynureninase
MLEAPMDLIREKSIALTERFLGGMRARGFHSITPDDTARRGSQVSFRHDDGYAIMQALIARGVIGDFRAPNLLRFGFAPLYNRFEDAWRAADILGEIVTTREWDQPRFRERKPVT